jgi:hypothetical protein
MATMPMTTCSTVGRIKNLYLVMPNAPMPPTDNGVLLWGEVEDNEH